MLFHSLWGYSHDLPKGNIMPNMANIVIKKADGTTDVTYTALTPSSGDKTFARWACKTVGATPAQNPQLSVKAESNGSGTARRVTGSFFWPTVSTDAGGNVVVNGGANATFSILIPQNQAGATIKEQAYQFGNLVANLLIKECMESGFAPQ